MDRLQKNQFQLLSNVAVTEILEQLYKSDKSHEQFLRIMLKVQCLLCGADAGAILKMDRESSVHVLALYPQLSKDISSPDWLAKSVAFGREAISSNKVIIKHLNEPEQREHHSAKAYVIIIPRTPLEMERTVAVFLILAEDKEALEICSQRLQLSLGMLVCSKKDPSLINWRRNCLRLQQSLETLSVVNRQKRFAGAAMAFCNEIAAKWQCERASLGFLKGKYVQLKAMSHTEDFSRKMKVVQDIESAMEECLDQDTEIISPAPKESAFINRATQNLSNRYGPLAVLSLPLRSDGNIIAVVTLERPADKPFSPDEIESVRLACELCTARLGNLYEYDRWIGAVIAAKSRKFAAAFLGPKYTWIKLAAILCCAAILFLIFGKGQFRAEAPFVLEATVQQVIPAPFDGYIKSVEVEVSDKVEAGNTILGCLDISELNLKLATARAAKAGYIKEADAYRSSGETAQSQIALAKADQADAQIELLEYQISQASLVSPISGVVVQGDLKRQIGAPVKVGDVLFEVCPLESLRAQLFVPEDQVKDIQIGQKGRLATASYPGERINFVVESISPIAEVVNQRNIFKVRVKLIETHDWMRPGMEGVAKVSIGRRHYAWIWSRKIVNWVRMKLWL
ncbi:MAG: HlyD family efflux transporter periplasmic adaptor subunit [Sedimentisphaerales bacterium]|nr:HlyD family efflux transporter periplasmic adaptor subunit [Sedimentisphaerales bacterium]